MGTVVEVATLTIEEVTVVVAEGVVEGVAGVVAMGVLGEQQQNRITAIIKEAVTLPL